MRKLAFTCLFTFLLANISAQGNYVATSWFDSYGDISWDEELLHLDNLAIYLHQNRNMIGYLAFYPGPGVRAKAFVLVWRLSENTLSKRGG